MAGIPNLWDDYKAYLINLMQCKTTGYTKLFNLLHNTVFEIVLDRDINRIKDAEDLRRKYFRDIGLADRSNFDQPVMVLEVLTALAVRIETEYIGDPMNPQPNIIFWAMISNLGLQKMRGDNFNQAKCLEILGNWMHRNFDKYGRGSIFPIKNTRVPQNEVEIWNQMMAYVNENFG